LCCNTLQHTLRYGNKLKHTATLGAPGTAAQPPEERFRVQLEKLRDMGFTDQASNIVALQATSGNLDAAIDRLLAGM